MSAGGPDALLLDEMFSQAIAAELTARGVDCRAVTADPVLRSLADLEIFETALAQTRVLVTNNVADFESLRRAREAAGGAVPGLIYTCDVAFTRDEGLRHPAGRRAGDSRPRPPDRAVRRCAVAASG